MAPIHKSSSPGTRGPEKPVPGEEDLCMGAIEVGLLRTSLLRWHPYTNLPLPGQASQNLATSIAPIHRSSSPGTGFSGPRYFDGSHTQIFLSRERLLRTSVLLWPPYTNLPLPGQASQDLATSMAPIHKFSSPGTRGPEKPVPGAPIHKSSSPGTGFSRLRYFDAPIHKSSSPGTGFSGPRYLYGPHTQIFRSSDLSGLTFFFCFPLLFSSMVFHYDLPKTH